MDSSANADAMERGVAVRSAEFDEKKERPQPSPTSTTLASGSMKRFGEGILFFNLPYSSEDFTTWTRLRLGSDRYTDNAASRAYSIRKALKSMFSIRESGSDEQPLIVRKCMFPIRIVSQ